LTGDMEFNRDLRKRAISLGLHLNEFGLWRWRNDEDMEPFWEMIEADTERDLLKELGMDYVSPEKRNFSIFVTKGKPKKRS